MDPHMNSSGARKRVSTNFPGNRSPDPEVGCERNGVVLRGLVRTNTTKGQDRDPCLQGSPGKEADAAPCLCESAGSTWSPWILLHPCPRAFSKALHSR